MQTLISFRDLLLVQAQKMYGYMDYKVPGLSPRIKLEHCPSGRKGGKAFDNKHSDNCVVLNELHFLVHLPHRIPAALPRLNKTAHSTTVRLDAIITVSFCIV